MTDHHKVSDVLYYECHITIDPVFGERLDLFKEVCKDYRFRVAELLMRKGIPQTEQQMLALLEPSKLDSFCTTRGNDYQEVEDRTMAAVNSLERNGFTIRRYKIEATLLDKRLT